MVHVAGYLGEWNKGSSMRDNVEQQMNYSNPTLLQWQAEAGKLSPSAIPTGMANEFSSATDLPYIEQRSRGRSPLIINLFFNGTEVIGVASTRDISGSGLYMTTRAEFPEGASLALLIPFGDEHIAVRGHIVYSNPGCGVGVRFDRVPAKECDLLRALAGQ